MNTPLVGSSLTRREAVKLALVGVAGVAIGVSATSLVGSRRRPTRPHRFFREDEATLLTAVCAQLIPADDAPGAAETGAVAFIDRHLMGRHRKHQGTYRNGLAALGRTAQQLRGRAFEQLAPDQQIAVLEAVEAGRGPKELWTDPTGPAFFNVVLAHTMQSFYGSPRHGGNRHHASQRMLGIDYPAIAGQNRYPKA
jgi:gluconate 2-dehydrogenase gamma chain